MRRKLYILFFSILFISAGIYLPPKKLKKEVLYYYSGNYPLSITSNEIFYNGDKIDSTVYNRNGNDSSIFRYRYQPGKCDVYIYQTRIDTLMKYFEYAFDSQGRLSKFIYFAENKIINEDNFYYNEDSKLERKFSSHGYYWLDSVNYSEHLYFVNSNNIDSIYNYYFTRDSVKILTSVSIFKYDNKINPFKSLLFDHIGERYFNSNNITVIYWKNKEKNEIFDSLMYNYSYDNESYLLKDMTNHTPWETDSSIRVYHYE